MFQWLFNWLFPTPKIGSVWTLHPRNPFLPLIRQEVIAVKNDWVRLRDLDSGKMYDANCGLLYRVFKEERCSL